MNEWRIIHSWRFITNISILKVLQQRNPFYSAFPKLIFPWGKKHHGTPIKIWEHWYTTEHRLGRAETGYWIGDYVPQTHWMAKEMSRKSLQSQLVLGTWHHPLISSKQSLKPLMMACFPRWPLKKLPHSQVTHHGSVMLFLVMNSTW